MRGQEQQPVSARLARESLRVIAIAGIYVSKTPDDVLITYSLGSCVGVSFFDPESGVGGLIHCMLPASKTNVEKAKEKPGMFVDSGVVAILDQLFGLGARKERLIVKVAGAASPMDLGGAIPNWRAQPHGPPEAPLEERCDDCRRGRRRHSAAYDAALHGLR